ncbi:stalk domain-containing protein [Paenibacillus foliorum]|nr:stalk domain-containing protein [Paenibacillus foliorum]
MKKFILGLVLGGLLSISTAAYATNSLEVLLFPVHFLINGQSKQVTNGYTVFNYNGNAYVPIRFIAENMAAEVVYDEAYNRVRIQQSTAKFDELTLAPSPLVTYEKKSKNGGLWKQEVPLLQGSGCWMGCADFIPLADLAKVFDYQPIPVLQKSSLVIQYPKGMEPDSIKVLKLVGNEKEENLVRNKYEELNSEKGRLVFTDEPGIYTLVIRSTWDQLERSASYVFVVEIK